MRFLQHGGGRHLGFVQTVNSAVRSAVPENPTIELNIEWIGSPAAVQSRFAETLTLTLTLNPNFGESGFGESGRHPARCRDMAIRVCLGHMEPPFWGEGEGVGGQRWHH